MSVPDTDTAVSIQRSIAPFVRDAVPADYPAIRDVVIAAYRQYADLITLDIFSPYLGDLLDLERHASHGRLLVVEEDGRIRGSAAFYPDSSVQGFGLPPGWAADVPSPSIPLRAGLVSRALWSPPANASRERRERQYSHSTRLAS